RGGGGKRIRPALLLLAAKLLKYEGRGAIKLGAVVEIIHTATLVHDDIIDEAKTRRGRPAANTQWGNAKCVLAGDWLYMQAFKIAVQERNLNCVTHQQILQTLSRYGCVYAAMARAHEYAEAARKAICTSPASDYKRALLWAPECVVARDK